jgi:acyl-CoA thioester hydrolase
MDIRVYYEDTDAAGMVYHARYLAFAERGRAEMLRWAGVPHADLVRNEGLVFVVRRIKIDYLRPARLDDVLHLTTRPLLMKAASAVLQQDFSVDGRATVAAEVELACVRGTDGRPSRIPARWREAFAKLALPAAQAKAFGRDRAFEGDAA